jgi:hypothetical protein
MIVLNREDCTLQEVYEQYVYFEKEKFRIYILYKEIFVCKKSISIVKK